MVLPIQAYKLLFQGLRSAETNRTCRRWSHSSSRSEIESPQKLNLRRRFEFKWFGWWAVPGSTGEIRQEDSKGCFIEKVTTMDTWGALLWANSVNSGENGVLMLQLPSIIVWRLFLGRRTGLISGIGPRWEKTPRVSGACWRTSGQANGSLSAQESAPASKSPVSTVLPQCQPYWMRTKRYTSVLFPAQFCFQHPCDLHLLIVISPDL